MAKNFAGKGGKKPQVEIPIENIVLDNENPRLVQYTEGLTNLTELDLVKIMQENFDTETIALSLIENGYFDEEPLIVVPLDLPENVDFSILTYEEATEVLENLIREKNLKFVVVEGNRRVTTIKLLLNEDLRKNLGIDKFYPKLENKEILNDISNIPCIVYPDREKVTNYLGVRHIAGLLKWEAFAKAAYIANTIQTEVDKGKSNLEAIKAVQNIVGDRSDTLRKQFVAYKLWEEARDNLPDFDSKPIIYKFSLLNVIYNSPSLRDFIGVASYKDVDFDKQIVPLEKLDNFKQVLTWVFGNNHIRPVLTDSRLITSTLSHIVRSREAIDYLNRFDDLQGAFERTNGEREFLVRNLNKAFRTLQESLSFAYKFRGDTEIVPKVNELEEIITELKKMLI
ncbi:hypothetical protein [Chryseobacterium camelliae]|uniref:hypothetical protein n=1 Tax=Chryseobacterium camelliae TaxID=1265445 RepID=UPI0028597163|nr:hypothetical protein [Chryseobacterium camelliae]MDR6515852.1 hypothetical protein [Chryseobacterium camelliae]